MIKKSFKFYLIDAKNCVINHLISFHNLTTGRGLFVEPLQKFDRGTVYKTDDMLFDWLSAILGGMRRQFTILHWFFTLYLYLDRHCFKMHLTLGIQVVVLCLIFHGYNQVIASNSSGMVLCITIVCYGDYNVTDSNILAIQAQYKKTYKRWDISYYYNNIHITSYHINTK